MAEKLKSYRLDPDKLCCPMCEAVFVGASPVAGTPGGFKKGLLTICAHCASILVMGDSAFEPVRSDRLKTYPQVTQNNLKMFQTIIMKQIDDRPEEHEA